MQIGITYFFLQMLNISWVIWNLLIEVDKWEREKWKDRMNVYIGVSQDHIFLKL